MRPRTRQPGRRHGESTAPTALALAAALALAVAGCGGAGAGSASTRAPATPSGSARGSGSGSAAGGGSHAGAQGAAVAPAHAPFAVGLRVLHLVDGTRTITLPDGSTVHRPLITYVRYPVAGAPGERDLRDARPAPGPFPLIVFGHGYAVTPAIYTRLLRSWARAGFIVAAPVFPLGNANAPGGPNEPDLVNQPADMSSVITGVLGAAAGPLGGLVDPGRIAVSGQSDGGDTALAVAYDPRYRDARVRAAVVLSGAEIPYVSTIRFPAHGPPLLAVQGTADTINPPELTETFFAAAPGPKFLLWLDGAEHLPPYTSQQPQLGIVERVSIAFLELYLEHRGSVTGLRALGTVPGAASLFAAP